MIFFIYGKLNISQIRRRINENLGIIFLFNIFFSCSSNKEKGEKEETPESNQNVPSSTDKVNTFYDPKIGISGASLRIAGKDCDIQNTNDVVWISTIEIATTTDYSKTENYEYYKNMCDFEKMQQTFSEIRNAGLKDFDFFNLWYTKYTQASEISGKINLLNDSEKAFHFMFWYFGDEIGDVDKFKYYIDALVDQEGNIIESEESQKYFNAASSIGNIIGKLKGTAYVSIEPEFNKSSFDELDDLYRQRFLKILLAAKNKIESSRKNTFDANVTPKQIAQYGLSFIYRGSKLDDMANCAKLALTKDFTQCPTMYNNFLDFLFLGDTKKLDYIGFQDVLVQFSRNPIGDGLIYYTLEKSGYAQIANRIKNMTIFLNKKYELPIFMSNFMAASGEWTDKNSNEIVDDGEVNYSGWNQNVSDTLTRIKGVLQEAGKNGLFAFSWMEAFDDPTHDLGGYQFLQQNEYALGLIQSGDPANYGKQIAIDGFTLKKDSDGKDLLTK